MSEYFMGIDTYDENSQAICVLKRNGDEIYVEYQKSFRDKVEFEKEVERISKFYNVIPIKEYE